MCAASNRSRERENKNENRDNYLRKIIYYISAENLLRNDEQFVNNPRFLHFFVSFWNNRGYFLLKNSFSLMKRSILGQFYLQFMSITVKLRLFIFKFFKKIRFRESPARKIDFCIDFL